MLQICACLSRVLTWSYLVCCHGAEYGTVVKVWIVGRIAEDFGPGSRELKPLKKILRMFQNHSLACFVEVQSPFLVS